MRIVPGSVPWSIWAVVGLALLFACGTGGDRALATEPLGAPTDLSASADTQTQIALHWTDNSAEEIGFEIERRTGDGTFTLIAMLGANVTTITNSGLTPGTSYTYRVRAISTAGASAYSNEAGATTPSAALIALTLSPTLLQGGQPVTGRLALDRAAPAGGVTVALSSDSPMVTVPADVTVPAGQTVATFTATTMPVEKRQQAKITAAIGGASREAPLTLLPRPSGDTGPPSYWITDLGLPPGVGPSQASAINGRGEVAGQWGGGPRDGAFFYAGSQIYTFGHNTAAFGVNDAGQVVGATMSGACIIDGTGVHQIGTLPGRGMSRAYGINATGQVAGESYGGGVTHAFLYSTGIMQDLGALNGGGSTAHAINSAGQVAGSSGREDHEHAFLYDSAGMRDLGTLGGDLSFAYGINDAGHVVGWSTVQGRFGGGAFLYDGAAMYDLGGAASQALSINNRGQIVGWMQAPGNGGLHATLWENGRIYDLNDRLPPGSGWVIVEATAINDAGQIACIGRRDEGDFNVQDSALLLTPTSVAPPPLPPAPANLTAGAPTQSGIDLTWSDDSITELGFEIERRSAGGTWQTVATVLPNTTRFQDTGLDGGTHYTYRVRAVNTAGGSAWTAEAEATTTGGPPKVSIDFGALSLPSSLLFGDQPVGAPSATQTITLTNTGAGPLAISSVTLQGPQTAEFLLVGDSGQATLAPGAQRVFMVRFTPTAAGTRSATLVIADNATGSPHAVALSGTGILSNDPLATAGVHGIAVFRPSSCEWLFRAVDGSLNLIPFGGRGDVPVPADYLGLGRSQVAVFRPGTREWFLRTEAGGTLPVTWGGPADLPVPGDYFGLHRAQIAVYRPTTREWFLRRDNGTAAIVAFGGPGDVPVPGDYFGLGRVSIAVYRPGTGEWFLRQDNGGTVAIPWGMAGDVPVPGDYFGLGRASLAVFRPSTREWFIRQDDGHAVVAPFGGPGDVPVPGDYFGLGRLQIGVYRPAVGEWYLRTDLGGTVVVPWGGPEDRPLPALAPR